MRPAFVSVMMFRSMKIFEVQTKDPKTRARLGILHTAHGRVETPTFCPIGTKASVKVVTSEELKFWGAELILANTYHLWLRPGDTLIRKAGGLHKFMGWDGPILTDSGGFQIFSLGEKSQQRNLNSDKEKMPFQVKVTDKGVSFRAGEDGSLHTLTPESSIQIQSNLGSDIALVLDDLPAHTADKSRVERSLDLTLEWARRAKRQFLKSKVGAVNPGQLLYGIVQGGFYPDLRKHSVAQLSNMGFDGYAIGGISIGEPPEWTYEVLKNTVPHMEEEKPRHLLGAGTPEQIVREVALGADTFDCVLPTRNARHGQLYVSSKTGRGYKVIKITQKKFEKDFTPVDSSCECYTCMQHTSAYLRHLFVAGEPLAIRLATMHNLRFYLNLMKKIRRAIKYDGFQDLLKTYKEKKR